MDFPHFAVLEMKKKRVGVGGLLNTISNGMRTMAGIFSPVCHDKASVSALPAKVQILAEYFTHVKEMFHCF